MTDVDSTQKPAQPAQDCVLCLAAACTPCWGGETERAWPPSLRVEVRDPQTHNLLCRIRTYTSIVARDLGVVHDPY